MFPPRHGGRPGPAARASARRARRFRASALLVAGVVALGGGAAVGAAVRSGSDDASDAARAVVRAADDVESLTSRGGARAPLQGDADRDGGGASGDADGVVDPTGLPAAVPAAPAVIDAAAAGPDGVTFADRNAGLLSVATPSSGTGQLVVVPGDVPAPAPDRPVRRVRVEVESGLAVDGEVFAAMVLATLNDPRSWGGDGSMTFARTDGDDQDLRVVLATPATVDAMCAPLNTHGDYSCGRYGHAAINFTRWVTATPEFADLTLYRQYVVNHEVGHLLGHPHQDCPAAGRLAPVMQQQSIQVAPCLPNAWPRPDGA